MQRPRIDHPIVVLVFGFVIFAIFVGAMVSASYQLRIRGHAVTMSHGTWLSLEMVPSLSAPAGWLLLRAA